MISLDASLVSMKNSKECPVEHQYLEIKNQREVDEFIILGKYEFHRTQN